MFIYSLKNKHIPILPLKILTLCHEVMSLHSEVSKGNRKLHTHKAHTRSFQVTEWKKKHSYTVTESSERIHPELNMEQQVLLKKKNL